jgi:hypothetical protein
LTRSKLSQGEGLPLDVKECDVLDDTQALALCASFMFGLALVLTQFGLSHVPPSRGASISIPTSALLLTALATFTLDPDGWDPRGALIFRLARYTLAPCAILLPIGIAAVRGLAHPITKLGRMTRHGAEMRRPRKVLSDKELKSEARRTPE